MPYLGETLELRHEPGRERVVRRGETLLVPAGDHRPALERWYRRRARAEIEPRLHDACASAGHELRSLSIRGQRTRWASCSPSGAMSFNWRLLLAPEPVLHTVVWHEVCHLDVAGPLAALLGPARTPRGPTTASTQRWLRRYGALLTLVVEHAPQRRVNGFALARLTSRRRTRPV